MKRYLILMLGCIVAVGLIAAGCGSDDNGDSGGGGGDALSKEDFLAQGNQICKDGNAALNAADAPAGRDEASLDAFVADTFVPNIQGQIDDLNDLTPPDEIADDVNKALDDAQTALDRVKDDPSTLANDTFADVGQQFTDIGLTECASD
jgi:hypothetical protein